MPELNAICSRIGEDGVDDPSWDIEAPSDPTDEIFAALMDFFTWYLTVRSPELPMNLLIESNAMAAQLIETLKRVFPERDGAKSGWKVGKAHDVLLVAEKLPCLV